MGLFVPIILTAQLESAFWYFGDNQGLDFTSGTAVPITDGELVTFEGCAAISTADGELIFYTDGENDTFTSNHVAMPNSNGLLGDNSSSQSAIIIPHPGDSQLYYIITVDANDNNPVNSTGMHYSLVNLNQNGGLGAIDAVEKNVNLLPRTSEKLTAVQHANGKDFWLITHFEDSFYSFLVDENGINTTPTVSQVGQNVPFSYIDPIRGNMEIPLYPNNSRGYLKANVQGSQIAIAHFSLLTSFPDVSNFLGLIPVNNPNNNYAYIQDGLLALYNFDNSSGVVSNEQILSDEGTFYGIEFSPNGRFLYATRDTFTPPLTFIDFDFGFPIDIAEGAILQFDLDSTSPQNNPIVLSTALTSNEFGARGALQLGLDQKIYHTQWEESALSVINEPNQLGALADFGYLQLDMPGIVYWGLPPFITSFFDVTIEIMGTVTGGNGCIGTELTFTATSNSTITQAIWDFGDGSPLITRTDLSPIAHTYTTAGTFVVEVELTDDEGRSVTETTTVTINENPALDNTQVELNVCEIDGDGLATFTLSDANSLVVSDTSGLSFSYFLTSEAATNGTATPLPDSFSNTSENQVIFVRVENAEGCFSVAEVTLSTENNLFSVSDLAVCDIDNDGAESFDLTLREGEILALPFYTLADSEYSFVYFSSEADAIANNSSAAISDPTAFSSTLPQTIWVRIEATDGCISLVSFDLDLLEPPAVNNASLQECEIDENGLANFTLSDANGLVVTDVTGLSFSYFLTSEAAMSGTATPLPDSFSNTSENQVVFVRVENAEGCFSVAEVTLSTENNIFSVSDLAICDVANDGLESFDLTLREAEILALPFYTLADSEYSFAYFSSEADALANTASAAIGDPTAFSSSLPQTIWVRIEATDDCISLVSFDLDLLEPPAVSNASLQECEIDGNGLATFTLSDANGLVVADVTGLSFSYFLTSEAATDGTATPLPDSFSNTSENQVVFVRVENVEGCFSVAEVTLSTENNIFEVSDLAVCDIANDGSESFDLTLREGEILALPFYTLADSEYSFTYFSSEADAIANTTSVAIADPTAFSSSLPQTIWVRVEATDGCTSLVSFDLALLEPPAVSNASLQECEIDENGLATFTLSDANGLVVADVMGLTFSYFLTSEAATDGTATPLPDSFSNTSENQVVFVRVENAEGCFSVAEVTLSTENNIFEVSDLAVCDIDNDGSESFDLTTREAEILALPFYALADSEYSFVYFSSEADAIANNSSAVISDPTAFSSSLPQSIWVRIEATDGCISLVSFDLALLEPPAVSNASLQECEIDENGLATFTLSDANGLVVADVTGLSFSYFLTSDEATDGTATPLPDSFSNTSENQVVFVRVENAEGCFSVAEITLSTENNIFSVSDLTVCDVANDGSESFDLTTREAEILALPFYTLADSEYSFTYFSSEADAIANNSSAVIADPTSFSSTLPQRIWVRVEAADGCTSLVSFDLTLLEPPVVSNANLQECEIDENGLATFTLSDANSLVVSDTNGLSFSYFLTSEAAMSGTATPLPDSFSNTSENQVIFVRVENPEGCFSVAEITLSTENNLFSVSDLAVCDLANDGSESFDLTLRETEILALPFYTLADSEYSFVYFSSEADAIANTTSAAIADPTSFSSSLPQTIWVRVEATDGCTSLVSFDLALLEPPAVNNASLQECEIDENGLATFTLSDANSLVVSDTNGLSFSYFLTSEAATDGTATPLPDSFSNTSENQIVFVRVENADGCFSVAEVTLTTENNIFSVSDLAVCDVANDGSEVFDFTLREGEILALPFYTLADSEYSFVYFSSEADALANTASAVISDPKSFSSTLPQRIWVRIEATDGCTSLASFDLDLLEPPAVSNASLQECEIDENGLGTFTLSDANSLVVSDTTGLSFSYFLTSEAATNGTGTPLPDSFSNTSENQVVFVRVENADGCFSVAEVTLTAENNIFSVSDLAVCDVANDGSESFDLTLREAEILALPFYTLADSEYSFVYFSSEADAIANNSSAAISDPTAFSSTLPQRIWVRVEATDDCISLVSFDLALLEPPAVNNANLQECEIDENGLATFTLSDANGLVVTDVTGLSFSYFLTSEAATNGTATPLPDSFSNTSENQVVFVRVENAEGCFSVAEVTLSTENNLFSVSDLSVCDVANDGAESFDLTLREAEILALPFYTLADSEYSFVYFSSEADALANTASAAIADPTAFTTTLPQRIWVRVEATDGCTSLVSFDLDLLEPPAVSNASLQECEIDENGLANFTLSDANSLVVSDTTGLSFSYFLTSDEATDGTGTPLPDSFSNTSENQVIFVRVENAEGCFSVAEVTLTTENNIFSVSDLAVCDVANDGSEVFDLTLREGEILALPFYTLADSEYSFVYFSSEADAIANTTSVAIADPTAFSSTLPQTIWVRVEATDGCISLASFDLALLEPPAVSNASLQECEIDENGLATFTLSDANGLVVTDVTGLSFSYFLTSDEAMSGTATPLPDSFSNTSENQVIFVRVENAEGCFSVAEVTLSTENNIFEVSDLAVCDIANDGSDVFDLTTREAEILALPFYTLADSEYSFVYFSSEADAIANNSSAVISDPTAFSSSLPQSIWVRVEATDGCISLVSFDLALLEPPAVSNASLQECEIDENGLATFTLSDANSLVVSDTTGLSFSYFLTSDEATDGTATPLPDSFSNTSENQVIFVRVENAQGCFSVAEVTLSTENNLFSVSDLAICDVANDGLESFDLTSREAEILALPFYTLADSEYSFVYFSSEADAIANTTSAAIADPTAFSSSLPQSIWVRIEATDGCDSLVSFDLALLESPAVSNASLQECEIDENGLATFTLSDANSLVVSDTTGLSFSYFLTSEAAMIGTATPLPDSFSNTSENQIVFVRVENAEGCFSVAEVTLSTENNLFSVSDLAVCDIDNDGAESFDLTLRETEILALPFYASADSEYSFVYFSSEADAIANNSSAAIADPTAFSSSLPQTIWVRIEATDGCTSLVSFDLALLEPPTVSNASLQECEVDENGLATFTLSDANGLVVDDVTGLSFSYFLTSEAATNGTGTPLPDSFSNTSENQVVFVRVENAEGCFSVAEVTLSTENNLFSVSNLSVCDVANDGSESFDLTTREAEILALPFYTLADSEYSFVYFSSEADALANTASAVISDPTSFSSTLPQTIWVRVEATDGCNSLVSFDLALLEPPAISNASLQECEIDENGLATFTLSDANSLVVSDTTGLSFSYFLTSEEATDGTGTPLPDSFSNTSENQVIFVRVENADGCFSVAEVTLSTENNLFSVSDLAVCDLANDGSEVFDLTLREAEILALPFYTLADSEYSFVYFSSEADALANTASAAIADPTAFSSNLPQRIWVRVEATDGCISLVRFELNLIDGIPLEIPNQQICEGDFVEIDGGAGFISYSWEGLVGQDLNQAANGRFIRISQEGTYTLTVDNGNCVSSAQFTVRFIDRPTVLDVITQGNTAQLLAQPLDSGLEYSIDGTNWQNSNLFSNLESGSYTAFVRNQSGCVSPERPFIIFLIPNIITPNGDGKNDFWQIPGLTAFPRANIQIFDRYGKMLVSVQYVNPNTSPLNPSETSGTVNSNFVGKTISDANKIWDGHYLGRPVPSTSYWYILELPTGEVFRGWVAVKNI